MVDYGSPKTQYVLKRFGDDMYRRMDINFKCKSEFEFEHNLTIVEE